MTRSRLTLRLAQGASPRLRRTCALLAPLFLVACGGTSPKDAEEDPLELIYPDEDGDGILDHHEGLPEDDADGDGIPNYLDLDSDGDGIPDAVEAGDDDPLTLPVDSDGDGIPDFLDRDSDNNCIDDADEGDEDLDGDGIPAYADLDDDGDGILDWIEIGEDCLMPDSDGDGIPDYQDPDSDGDGIGDIFEAGTNPFNPYPVDTDGDNIPDYLDLDSDGDGIPDSEESGGGPPWEPPRDTDNDGIPDFQDTDSDNDGLSDFDEVNVYFTNPYLNDTDGDGFSDGAEVRLGSDPLDPNSIIEGLYVVVPERTDVQEIFTFELSIKQGDVAFLLDTTGSMGSTLNAMANEFSQIVNQLSVLIPDANYGVGTFADYNYGGFGSGSDRPFVLRQQITSNQASVQTALNGLSAGGGADGPESGAEALYQTLTGTGYDQNCNGSFDSSTDVPPFMAHPTDPFHGTRAGAGDPTTPGTGTRGGMGFRDFALPVIVYATDYAMREADSYPTPGGCPGDAAGSDVVAAANALNAYLIGIAVNNSTSGTLHTQMTNLATATGSFADLNGDGIANEPLVFTWSSGSATFRNTIVNAISDLVSSVLFNEITLEIVGDDKGFVVDIDPPVYRPTGAVSGDVINFNLTFRGADTAGTEDQLHQLTLNVIGDGSVLLDTMDIIVLVPGSTL